MDCMASTPISETVEFTMQGMAARSHQMGFVCGVGDRACGIDPRLLVLGRLSQALWVFDVDSGRIHWANDTALGLWHATTLDALRARDMQSDMSPAVAARLRQYQQDIIDHDISFSEVWTIYPLGVPHTLRLVFSGFPLSDGRMALLCEVLGEHRIDPENLRSADALIHTPVMITLYNRHARGLYRNPAARESCFDLLERGVRRFVDPIDARSLFQQLKQRGRARLVARVRTAQGERWHDISAQQCLDPASGLVACLVSEVDISDLKRAEARAQYLAHHDPLTALPNRQFVLHRYQERLDAIRDQGSAAALIFIDLDRFKNINDSLGHAAGDQLLVMMAERLRAELRDKDLVARLGGDEFLVLIESPDIREHVAQLAQRLLRVLGRSVEVADTDVQVTASLGICVFPDNGHDIHTLMRHADLAMYRAKDGGRDRMAWFDQDMTRIANTRLALENELRHALQRKQFELHYQPVLDIRSNAVVGAEALLRWNRPGHDQVPPSVFIPICEECGLMDAIGDWVLMEAARQQVRWAEAGCSLRIAVNLSVMQFQSPHLLETCRDVLSQTGCDAGKMELEVTESMLLGNDERTVATLDGLRGLGFRLAIDDFGTGYSNLAYLQRYPFSALKIDRSFIAALDSGTPIAELVISLCHLLGMDIVAEGVESQNQLEWLQQRNCDTYQGFLYSPALPAEQFLQRICKR